VQHATVEGVHGTFNIAGSGILMLSQALRRLGRPSVPMPSFAANQLGSFVRQSRVADFSPEQMAYLTYGRGVDTTRMRKVLGFEPEHTTASAFDDMRRSLGPGLVSADRFARVEDRLARVEDRITHLLGAGRG
jgi:UDP-glucose 4-epimerase